MDYRDRINHHPEIMLGKPVIKGTRISVETILKKLSEGATLEELLKVYPTLSKEDIYASLHYASAIIANEEIIIPKAS